METFILLFIGITTGFLTGFLGIGGGVIVVPALTLLVSMEIKEAIGTSTVKIFLSVLCSNIVIYLSKKEYYNFPLKPVLWLSMGAVLGSPVGAMCTHLFPDILLYLVFSLLIAYFAFQMSFKKECVIRQETEPKGVTGRTPYIILGIVTGFASGLLGVGGAFIMVPVMYSYFSLSMYCATSISFLVLLFVSLFGSLIHYLNNYVDISAALILTLGALPMTILGAHLRAKVSPLILRYSFAFLLLIVAVRMFWEVLWD